MVEAFLMLIQDTMLQIKCENKLVWKLNKEGNLCVKSYVSSLAIFFPVKDVWVLKLLQKQLSLFGEQL